jgi:hypothetical protein
VRHERDTIAALRAQWSELDNPARIEALAKRFLPLKPIAPTQFDKLDNLPDRAPDLITPDGKDPIRAMLEKADEAQGATGSIPAAAPAAPAPESTNQTPAPVSPPDAATREGR